MDESITHNTNSGLTLPDTRGSVGRASRGASAIFQDGGGGGNGNVVISDGAVL